MQRLFVRTFMFPRHRIAFYIRREITYPRFHHTRRCVLKKSPSLFTTTEIFFRNTRLNGAWFVYACQSTFSAFDECANIAITQLFVREPTDQLHKAISCNSNRLSEKDIVQLFRPRQYEFQIVFCVSLFDRTPKWISLCTVDFFA